MTARSWISFYRLNCPLKARQELEKAASPEATWQKGQVNNAVLFCGKTLLPYSQTSKNHEKCSQRRSAVSVQIGKLPIECRLTNALVLRMIPLTLMPNMWINLLFKGPVFCDGLAGFLLAGRCTLYIDDPGPCTSAFQDTLSSAV